MHLNNGFQTGADLFVILPYNFGDRLQLNSRMFWIDSRIMTGQGIITDR